MSRFSYVQSNDSCLHRISDPVLKSRDLVLGQCDTSKPRVNQKYYVDSPACMCSPCPNGWTSTGGPPSVTFCFPEVIPRYFKMEIEMATPSNFSDYDFTNLPLAAAVMDAFAKEMSQDVASHEIVRFGAVQRMNVGQLNEVSVFACTYTFKGTEVELAQLMPSARACAQLSYQDDCDLCSGKAGWNLCSVFASVAPLSIINQLGVSSIMVDVDEKPNLVRLSILQSLRWLDICVPCLINEFRHPFAQNPLTYQDNLPATKRRKLFNFFTTFLPLFSFFASLFKDGGKFAEIGKKEINREGTGIAISGGFLLIGVICNLINIFNTKPDPYLPYFKEIIETTTKVSKQWVDAARDSRLSVLT